MGLSSCSALGHTSMWLHCDVMYLVCIPEISESLACIVIISFFNFWNIFGSGPDKPCPLSLSEPFIFHSVVFALLRESSLDGSITNKYNLVDPPSWCPPQIHKDLRSKSLFLYHAVSLPLQIWTPTCQLGVSSFTNNFPSTHTYLLSFILDFSKHLWHCTDLGNSGVFETFYKQMHWRIEVCLHELKNRHPLQKKKRRS